jgi:hypothetical protein
MILNDTEPYRTILKTIPNHTEPYRYASCIYSNHTERYLKSILGTILNEANTEPCWTLKQNMLNTILELYRIYTGIHTESQSKIYRIPILNYTELYSELYSEPYRTLRTPHTEQLYWTETILEPYWIHTWTPHTKLYRTCYRTHFKTKSKYTELNDTRMITKLHTKSQNETPYWTILQSYTTNILNSWASCTITKLLLYHTELYRTMLVPYWTILNYTELCRTIPKYHTC